MIKILLIEDDLEESVRFGDRYSSELVSITPVTRVADAFHELDNSPFDLCVIDPIMTQTLDFNRLLEELIRREVELKVVHPGRFIPDYFVKAANNRGIDVVSLNNQKALAEMISDLIKKKSTGTSTRIASEQQNQAIKTVKLEVWLERLTVTVDANHALITRLEDKSSVQALDLVELKNNQAHVTGLLVEIKKDIGGIQKIDPGLTLTLKKEEEGTKKFVALVSIIAALITTLGVASPVLIPFFRDHFLPPRQEIKRKP